MTAALDTVAPTLWNALAAYQDYRLRQARFSLHTWAGEKPGLLGFIDSIGDQRTVDTVTPEDVDTWWNMLNVADSTRRTRLAQLRSFLHYCRELRGWLEHDPTLLLRTEKPYATERRRLTRDQLLELLLLAAGPRERALLALAMNLALRGSEISELRVRDVNLAAGTVEVRISKTRQADRMPVTVELDHELRRWLLHYRAAVPGLRPDSYLIPAQHYQPSTGRTTYRHDARYAEPHRVVKAALEAYGWDTTLQEGVHTIRRSVARVYFDMISAEDGENEALLATMALLHHAEPRTTLRYIGYDRQREARDSFLRGQRFLTRGRLASVKVVAQ